MKLYVRLLLSCLSGLLLFLAWVPSYFPFLIFFAFIPLFFISENIEKEQLRFPFLQGMHYSFPALLVWNVLTTWWIWNSTPQGSVATFILNALLMSFIFGFWQWFRRLNRSSEILSPLFFITAWISFEFLHLHWDLSWPWLNLGNVFASTTQYVQWYEFTGVFGGTLWVLIANFLFYYWIQSFKKDKKRKTVFTVTTLCWLIIPITISLIQYYTYKPKHKDPIDVIIVQQNTDPWVEQYHMANLQHAERITEVVYPYLTPKTQLIVTSESSIPHTLLLDSLIQRNYPANFDLYNPYAGFVLFDTLLSYYPNLNIIAGLSTGTIHDTKISPVAQQRPDGRYWIFYNSSVCYNREGVVGVYHKSKLVPGVELMPFPKIFGFLENFILRFGGANCSLGKDTLQRVFSMPLLNGSCNIGVPICYESVYGELFSHFVVNGASLMAVITNDAWWDDTPGHRQHFLYAKLRAIETRRTILRSANTGFSGIINERGDVLQKTAYNERTAIHALVYPNDKLTFYTLNGDYIARIALFTLPLLLLFSIFVKIKTKIKRVKK